MHWRHIFTIVRHVYVAKLLRASVLGCISWTRKTDTAAENGLFYGLTTDAACMTACLRLPTCAAIDLGPVGCVLHNVSDLTTTYYAAGVTHFILNRTCQSQSQLTTEPSVTATTSEAIIDAISLRTKTPTARTTRTPVHYQSEIPGTSFIFGTLLCLRDYVCTWSLVSSNIFKFIRAVT